LVAPARRWPKWLASIEPQLSAATNVSTPAIWLVSK
jgi:hypothetical protein